MYNIDEVVIYTTYGICQIKEIREIAIGDRTNRYYVLVPLFENNTELTLPIDNPITNLRLHSLLSKDEVNELIKKIPSLEPYWIENENERKKQFSDIIKAGNREETLKLIKSIKYHAIDIKDKNRKLHACDETHMKEAEKLIVDEFSYVLEKNKDDVANIINENIYANLAA